VINCAGPFYKWGTNVLASAARNGRGYVDITGEDHWILDMIEKYDYLAFKTGATIIPASGFDSVPADIAAFLSVQTLKTLIGPEARAAKSVTAHALSGQFSGGTAATILATFNDVPREQLSRSMKPFALSPIVGPTPRVPRLLYSLPHLARPIRGAFFLMSGINQSVVRRTWGLLESRAPPDLLYGPSFDYEEFMAVRSVFLATIISLALFSGGILLGLFAPARWAFSKVIPQPGDGPSPEQRKLGWYKGTNITSSAPSSSSPRTRHVRTIIKGHSDPGYHLAAVMVSESALALLPANREGLTALGREGGLLTPMSAIGGTLIERLKKTTLFDFESTELVDGGRTEAKKIK